MSSEPIRQGRAGHLGRYVAGMGTRARGYLRGGHDVVVDAVNLRASDRRRWLRIAAECGATARLVVIECDPEVAAARNAQRPEAERVPAPAMSRCLELLPQLEAAVSAEGWAGVDVVRSGPSRRW